VRELQTCLKQGADASELHEMLERAVSPDMGLQLASTRLLPLAFLAVGRSLLQKAK